MPARALVWEVLLCQDRGHLGSIHDVSTGAHWLATVVGLHAEIYHSAADLDCFVELG